MNREQLVSAVTAAIRAHGGAATIVEVARHIWDHHEAALKASGDLFYTWQYEMRWAAQKLRNEGKLALARREGRNLWQLT